MATPKKIGIFFKPADHNIEAAKLKHLMTMRGVDSVRATVDGAPALIEVSSLELPISSERAYEVTADFNDNTMQLDAAPLATAAMETILKQFLWYPAESV